MEYSTAEMMAVAAARVLKNDDVCFVGIGAPSVACNLARLTHAPLITLIYESGTIGTKPDVLPLSIGDPELCETALTTVSVPEMFQYWLPGGGGAPEIASLCGQTYVVMRQARRTFVHRVDFITSFGYGAGGDHRQRLGIHTLGPTLVVTDLCLLRPDPQTKELIVTSIHRGITREDIAQQTGWQIRFVDTVEQTPPPSEMELAVLRDLQARTERAHAKHAAP
jgi:glutaconate CoA-transferase subunit B